MLKSAVFVGTSLNDDTTYKIIHFTVSVSAILMRNIMRANFIPIRFLLRSERL